MSKENTRNNWKLSEFGKTVKKKLIERDMTVSQLADEIGTSRSFLSQVLYESKKGNECIKKIKDFLDIYDEDDEISEMEGERQDDTEDFKEK